MFNKLYTGYFAKTKKYIEAGYTPVSVAGKTPDFFTGEHWVDFAPRKEMFIKWKNGETSNEEYMNEYLQYLKTISKEDIEELREITQEKDFVMCCYERPDEFCHRHALAKFLTEEYGFTVAELWIL